jgi:hypothetical protein
MPLCSIQTDSRRIDRYMLDRLFISSPEIVPPTTTRRPLTLSPLEEQQLKHSAQVLRQAIERLAL